MNLNIAIERLKELRRARRLTLNQLDSRADLAHSYSSRLERGLIPNPGILQLQRIAVALGVKLSSIIAESEERPTSGEVVPEPALPPLTEDLADVASDLLAIQRLDPERLDIARRVVADIRGQAETQARRARRVNSTRERQHRQHRPPGRAK